MWWGGGVADTQRELGSKQTGQAPESAFWMIFAEQCDSPCQIGPASLQSLSPETVGGVLNWAWGPRVGPFLPLALDVVLVLRASPSRALVSLHIKPGFLSPLGLGL
jgi:hypothetical protein